MRRLPGARDQSNPERSRASGIRSALVVARTLRPVRDVGHASRWVPEVAGELDAKRRTTMLSSVTRYVSLVAMVLSLAIATGTATAQTQQQPATSPTLPGGALTQ